jgi:hypothetical protein
MMRSLLILLLIVVAGCESTPRPPLMSPIEQGGSYGYSERQIGPQDWEVTYVGPARSTTPFLTQREADNAAARTQAFDFMLWRAAQIAQAQGYAGFRVGQTRSNVDTQIEDYAYDPFWGPGYGPWGWGYPGWGPGWRRRPYFPHPYHGRSSAAYLQARLSADIHLVQTTVPGDYLAEDVIRQARRSYPSAEGVPTAEGVPAQ